jgi:hypothetical protein
MTKRVAVLGHVPEFCLTKKFFLFMWGEISRVSPHLARASRLRLTGWRAAVRRQGLNFASGGAAKFVPGEAKFVRNT